MDVTVDFPLAMLLAVALGQACKTEQDTEARRRALPHSATSAAASSSTATQGGGSRPSASANAAPVAVEGLAAPPTTTVPCIAAAKKGQLSLGAQSAEIVSHTLRAWGDDLLLLSNNRPNARITLLRLRRDGSGKTAVGSLAGIAAPDGLWVTPRYAYTTFKLDLWRFPLAGGDAELVVQGFSRPIAVAGSHVYGVRCAKRGKADALVRVGLGGDGLTVLASIARKSELCDYRSLALTPNGTDAVLSDWPGKRLLSVSLSEGAVKELATSYAFPRDIVIGPRGVDFATSNGLRRILGAGGSVMKLAAVGATPYMDLAFDRTHYWIFQGEPYQPTESIWRMSRSGGDAKKVWTFPDRGDSQGTGIDSLAVDDQCVYYSMYAKSGDYFTVYARAKSD